MERCHIFNKFFSLIIYLWIVVTYKWLEKSLSIINDSKIANQMWRVKIDDVPVTSQVANQFANCNRIGKLADMKKVRRGALADSTPRVINKPLFNPLKRAINAPAYSLSVSTGGAKVKKNF